MICECYRSEKNFLGKVGSCWGTAERDACSCGGDKSKCDFYPAVRETEKKPITNYDRIVSKSPEELAEWLAEVLFHCSNTICDERCPMYECCCEQPSDNIEDWLKEEATE